MDDDVPYLDNLPVQKRFPTREEIARHAERFNSPTPMAPTPEEKKEENPHQEVPLYKPTLLGE